MPRIWTGLPYIPLDKNDVIDIDALNKLRVSTKDSNGIVDITKSKFQEVPLNMKNMNLDVDGYLSGNISEAKLSNSMRDINFKNANSALAKQSEKELKVFLNVDALDFNKKQTGDVAKTLLQNKWGCNLTIHEDFYMKKAYYLPSIIHGNVRHTGGVSNSKFYIRKIPDIVNNFVNKSTQFAFRYSLEY